jgi:hypothetical protein
VDQPLGLWLSNVRWNMGSSCIATKSPSCKFLFWWDKNCIYLWITRRNWMQIKWWLELYRREMSVSLTDSLSVCCHFWRANELRLECLAHWWLITLPCFKYSKLIHSHLSLFFLGNYGQPSQTTKIRCYPCSVCCIASSRYIKPFKLTRVHLIMQGMWWYHERHIHFPFTHWSYIVINL